MAQSGHPGADERLVLPKQSRENGKAERQTTEERGTEREECWQGDQMIL
jgi:hypothetical protein